MAVLCDEAKDVRSSRGRHSRAAGWHFDAFLHLDGGKEATFGCELRATGKMLTCGQRIGEKVGSVHFFDASEPQRSLYARISMSDRRNRR